MVDSREKGARGEREALKILKEWWGGEPWKRRGLGQEGADITTPSDFPWTVEVKNTAQYNLGHLLFPNQKLKDHIKQTIDQVEENRKPLLLSKIDKHWMVAEFKKLVGIILPTKLPDCNYSFMKLFNHEITWTPLEDFIKRNARPTATK